ncbi:hypothetical protein CPPEL_09040 [Corynebacterium pseudopelargi]|uniref:Uncharacterized protein n=2 Tax=Corynebacterium pseudopelargi TaxID=2080757 RepID=A0A3G6IVU7_9CORY|nr:hypothetical protein CPPEL_09040 [Corynebacterium pseudopelargi]
MVDVESVENLSALSRHERIAVLRNKVAAMSNAAPDITAPQEPDAQKPSSTQLIEVAPGIAQVLPDGGLLRRCVYECSPTPAFVVELIAQLSAQGMFVAVVGWPELSLAGVLTSGGDTTCVVAIPDPGEDPLSTLGVLVEGIDVVIYRGAPITLSPVRARPLLARLRKGVAALVMVGMQVGSPRARLEAQVRGFRGIGEGQGRIKAVDLEVTGQAKAFHARSMISIGQPRTLYAVDP